MTHRHAPKREPVLAFGMVLAIVAGVVLGSCQGGAPGKGAHPSEGLLIEYPESWKTNLSEAVKNASFSVILPEHTLANDDNVTGVWLQPDGTAIFIDYPVPESPAPSLRQPYLEVYETPWAGGDPAKDFATDIAENPAVGKRLYVIDGIPVLGVNAHSPSDDEQANPALLDFVESGVEIQLSGGEDLQRLIEIARTMIGKASPPPSPSASSIG